MPFYIPIETAALLADEVLPALPLRQWVVSFPFALRFLFAARPDALAKALEIIYRLLATHLAHKAGFTGREAATGAVTLVQRFGSALNLNIHLHMLCLDGVYAPRPDGGLRSPGGGREAAHGARLAALVPRPRVNLTRYHGVLAPNHRWRAEVTPSGRGRGRRTGTAQPERSAIERHAAMTWAQRLRRVFSIDAESCVRCGKAVRVIACIEEPALIERILTHVRGKRENSAASLGPPSTGPPESA